MLFRYLTWAFDDRYFIPGIDLIHTCLVDAALVHRHLLGNTFSLHGLVKKAQGCIFVALGRQHKVGRLSFLVHRTVQVFTGAFDFDASLVHASTGDHQS